MKKILTMTVREIYAVLLIISMLLFSLIYTSMALFQKTVEKVGIATIIVGDINFNLITDESDFNINENSGTITVLAGETKSFDLTILNSMANSTRYKLYYRFSNDVTILNVNVGISSNSEYTDTDIIDFGASKTVKIVVENNSEQSATIEIGVQGGYATNETIILNSGRNEMQTIIQEYKDESGANIPLLSEGMIPVIYNETDDVWEIADTNTAWYDYNSQMWANAVTTSVESHRVADPGTPIPIEDINSMWVWIPRYRYKISSGIGSSVAVTNPPQIDVIFETETETNGVTEAVYKTGISNDGTNVNYYTHPAFRNADNIEYDSSTTSKGAWDEEITGFWVGKFETGGTIDNPLIKPDIPSLSNLNINTQFLTSLKFADGIMDATTGEITFNSNINNKYGLNIIANTTDTHMMKNTEWGAVAILSQSQYGKMGNNNYDVNNKEIYINDSAYTGRSSGTIPNDGYSTYGTYSYNNKTCQSTAAECIGEKVLNAGTGASTTGNIYGVYDMSGGLYEYTMGNWNGKYDNYDGFNILPNKKYYDIYDGNTSDSIINKVILGDLIYETMLWYSDSYGFADEYNYWSLRGGSYLNSTESGIFYSQFGGNTNSTHNFNEQYSFRTVLIP